MTEERDYSKTLYLPQTDFPMRAGLPKNEPKIQSRWDEMDIYRELRKRSAGREKYVLHDGPPYANGNLHIGHALNKTIKDIITRSFQMRGFDSNYVPGWDCHGLPIEWKVEEKYRKKKQEQGRGAAVNEFRQECRDYRVSTGSTIAVRSQLKRLGINGRLGQRPIKTMTVRQPRRGSSRRAAEICRKSGQLYPAARSR